MAKVYRYRINNSTFQFDDIIYVDPVNGNDSSGNGSNSSPYKTIKKSIDSVNKNNTGIILSEGIYNETPWAVGMNSNGSQKAVFATKSYSMYFIGQGLNTIVNIAFTEASCSVVMPITQNLYMYNIVINVDCIYSGANYSNTFITSTYNYGGTANIYNCIFNYVNHFGNRTICFNNYSTNNCYNCIFDMGSTSNAYGAEYAWYDNPINMYNCVFKNIANWGACYNAVGKFAFYNCIYPNLSGARVHSNNNSLGFDVMFDNSYNIINTNIWRNAGNISYPNPDNSINHIGVYGGAYQWRPYTVKPAEISINNYAAKVNKNEDYNFGFSINAPFVPDMIYNEQVPNGKFINNNIIYSYPLNKTAWTAIKNIEIL